MNKIDINLTALGAQELANALKENTSLTALNISGILFEKFEKNHNTNIRINIKQSVNEIGDEGLIKLTTALKENKSLRLLSIGCKSFKKWFFFFVFLFIHSFLFFFFKSE